MAISWGKITILLCCFGFLKEFRPSESFVTQYLLGPEKNFTKSQVNESIYPVGTYSNLTLLVLVFIVTDWLRYKPVIVVEAIAGVLVYSILIWGHTLSAMMAVEFFYGLFMASEVAYYTYIYAKCDKKHFQKVSGYVRSAILLGRFVSGVVSQVSISFQLLSYHQLNFLTLAGIGLSLPFACLLPSASNSFYFHRIRGEETISKTRPKISSPTEINMEDIPLSVGADVENKPQAKRTEGMRAIVEDFLNAYRNKNIFKWSIWWSLGTCGYLQTTSYIQVLWQVTAEDGNQELFNGAVDAVYTLIGAAAAWFIGRQKINLQTFSSYIIIVCCILQGILLLVCSTSQLLWVQYLLYVIFKVLYHSTMVLASSEVAKSLPGDSHGLIFGFNMFVALALQTILTIAVAAKGGLRLNIRDQFLVYGGYFIFLGVAFSLSICMISMKSHLQSYVSGKSSIASKSVAPLS